MALPARERKVRQSWQDNCRNDTQTFIIQRTEGCNFQFPLHEFFVCKLRRPHFSCTPASLLVIDKLTQTAALNVPLFSSSPSGAHSSTSAGLTGSPILGVGGMTAAGLGFGRGLGQSSLVTIIIRAQTKGTVCVSAMQPAGSHLLTSVWVFSRTPNWFLVLPFLSPSHPSWPRGE